MLWVKAFHIVFVAAWFAGLFYLPRIFVNLAMVPVDSHAERERLLLMAHKLHRFTSILMGVALLLGFWVWLGFGATQVMITVGLGPTKRGVGEGIFRVLRVGFCWMRFPWSDAK